MKRVLVLAYHFPPEGGPAVQRVLKFVKYLPENGYQPVVLTAKHPLPVRDASLLADLPSGVRVRRVMDWAAWMPSPWRRAAGRRRFPDRHISWRKAAVRRAVRIVREEGIDLLFASSPPHSVQIIASEIADRTGIPWVADLRDEWAMDPNVAPSVRDRMKQAEKEALSRCRAVVSVTPQALKNIRAAAPASAVLHFLPNGYDPEDFPESGPEPKPAASRLTIAYCGRFTRKSDPSVFLSALEEILRTRPEWADRIALRVIGGTGNRRAVRDLPNVRRVSEFSTYQPHRAVLSVMRRADALLLLATGTAASEVLTQKVFEYMATGNPILAVAHGPGELTRMMSAYRNARVAFQGDPASVKAAVLKLLDDWRRGRLNRPCASRFVKRFDRREQAADLSRLFDRVLRNRAAR
ncbi:MAG: glycosyltransferase family 4 protein [bacterium]|nr:glycosyltransferase family 4 protein [bacterium]